METFRPWPATVLRYYYEHPLDRGQGICALRAGAWRNALSLSRGRSSHSSRRQRGVPRSPSCRRTTRGVTYASLTAWTGSRNVAGCSRRTTRTCTSSQTREGLEAWSPHVCEFVIGFAEHVGCESALIEADSTLAAHD